MRTLKLSEAKQKLSELVKRAAEGERIGITRRGKLAALIVSAHPETNLKDVFGEIDRIRRRARRAKGVSVKRLIEKGRNWNEFFLNRHHFLEIFLPSAGT